jgi:uncharacterized metal-binding protein YceD (DUF177 family)
MMDTAPELSRRFALADIGAEPKTVTVVADAGERKALARRFALGSLDALMAHVELAAVNSSIEARGTLSALMSQTCVATAQTLSVKLEEPFQIRFEPPSTQVVEEEFELSADDCDVMEHDGQAIDLGEAVAQTLGLAIDPFPRAPNADAILKATGILAEQDVGPFAKLKGLLGKD